MRRNIIKTLKDNVDKIIIAFDTETTGLDSSSDLITEIGAYKLKYDKKGHIKISKPFHLYINVPKVLSPKITELTGLTNDFLSKYPTENQQWKKIYNFFGNAPVVLGHNIPFDVKMLNALYARYGKNFIPVFTIDTLEMARDVIGDDIKNHKLGTIAEYYGFDADFHKASEDILMTCKIFSVCFFSFPKR